MELYQWQLSQHRAQQQAISDYVKEQKALYKSLVSSMYETGENLKEVISFLQKVSYVPPSKPGANGLAFIETPEGKTRIKLGEYFHAINTSKNLARVHKEIMTKVRKVHYRLLSEKFNVPYSTYQYLLEHGMVRPPRRTVMHQVEVSESENSDTSTQDSTNEIISEDSEYVNDSL